MTIAIATPPLLGLLNNIIVNLVGVLGEYGAIVFGFAMLFWGIWFAKEIILLIRDLILKGSKQ